MIREGSDITLVGWGAQLSIMEQACVEAEKVDSAPNGRFIIQFILVALLVSYSTIRLTLKLFRNLQMMPIKY